MAYKLGAGGGQAEDEVVGTGKARGECECSIALERGRYHSYYDYEP